MQLTIKAKLLCVTALMLVLMALLGVNGGHGNARAGAALESVLATSGALRNHLEGDMMHDALRADVLAALLADTQQDWQAVDADLKEHADHFRELIAANQQLATGEAKEALAGVDATLESYIASAESIIATARTDKAAARAALPAFSASFKELENALSDISDQIQNGATAAEEDAARVLAIARNLGVALLLIAVVISLAASAWIVRTITGGIERIAVTIQRMASGELGRDIRIDSTDECGRLLGELRDLDEKLGGIVGLVRVHADSVGAAARQLSHGNDDLSQRTQEQAAALEQTASSMEEIAVTVKRNAENARAASQLAVGARGQADRGGAIVQQAVAAMGEINESSRRIADIVGVIDEIAFQTNLLALNAAVEAARAGEQGRGFAVVASEVRSLAQRSAAAAREVKTLIEDSVRKVGAGSELVDRSGRVITDIMEGVRKVTDIVSEIAAASEEQASGIEQVNRAVAQMDSVTQQNAALVEEGAAATKSMEHQTHELVQEVSFFRTGAAGTTASHQTAPRRVRAPQTHESLLLAKAS